MPTYDNPGNCPKCDHEHTKIKWVQQQSHLRVVCKRCGYEWIVQAKDEL